MKLTIELDCTDDDCVYESGPKAGWLNVPKLTKKLKAETRKYGLKVKLVNPSGPGGGCPVYAFTGEASMVRQWCHQYEGCASAGDETFLEQIAPLDDA